MDVGRLRQSACYVTDSPTTSALGGAVAQRRGRASKLRQEAPPGERPRYCSSRSRRRYTAHSRKGVAKRLEKKRTEIENNRQHGHSGGQEKTEQALRKQRTGATKDIRRQTEDNKTILRLCAAVDKEAKPNGTCAGHATIVFPKLHTCLFSIDNLQPFGTFSWSNIPSQ